MTALATPTPVTPIPRPAPTRAPTLRPAAPPVAPTARRDCLELAPHQGSGTDVAPLLQRCYAETATHGTLALPAGRYLVNRTFRLDRPVTLTTIGQSRGGAPCNYESATDCVELVAGPALDDTMFVLQADAEGTRIDHIEVDGQLHAMGILLTRSDSSVTNIVGKHAVRTALLVNLPQKVRIEILNNTFINNGIRGASPKISDGVTLNELVDSTIEHNRFVNNTDVHLILGGCQRCAIRHNSIEHTPDPLHFAHGGLFLYTWGSGVTSGNYTGSDVAYNIINASAGRMLGLGLYIGHYSWNDGPAIEGGHVHDNNVWHARMGIYVDHASNTLLSGNGVYAPPGTFFTSCAGRSYASSALNVAEDPRLGGLLQIDMSRQLDLWRIHTVQNLRGCVPTP